MALSVAGCSAGELGRGENACAHTTTLGRHCIVSTALRRGVHMACEHHFQPRCSPFKVSDPVLTLANHPCTKVRRTSVPVAVRVSSPTPTVMSDDDVDMVSTNANKSKKPGGARPIFTSDVKYAPLAGILSSTPSISCADDPCADDPSDAGESSMLKRQERRR